MLDFFLNYRFTLDLAIMLVWVVLLGIPFIIGAIKGEKV